ncbi:protein big brother-like isoform X2 [Bacillus rossius redtenbacheri]|uniref:protein big brother-like isoform X2 n=1 Tax=Bacillus rossius redtenbacheri TaxID=93214 RepID=UPI002FDD74BA
MAELYVHHRLPVAGTGLHGAVRDRGVGRRRGSGRASGAGREERSRRGGPARSARAPVGRQPPRGQLSHSLRPSARLALAMHAMNDPAALAGMLPFDSIGLYEQPKPRFIFKMPRVVPDQKAKFESDELFRRLSRESEIRYTGYRDRPQEERQVRFQNGCREGHTEIAFVATGTNIQLVFNPSTNGYSAADPGRECDFDKEHGKVHIRSHFIMNGVCVRWRGWIDLERLDGVGCLEYDEERAQMEDSMLRDQIERYNQRLRDFEEKQRAYRQHQERPGDQDLELRMASSLQHHVTTSAAGRCHVGPQRVGLSLQARKKGDLSHGHHH